VNIGYRLVINLDNDGIMMFTIPLLTYKNRLLIITLGIIILVWSGLEDNQVWGVVLLGWILAIVSVAHFMMSRFGNRAYQATTLIKLSPLIGGSIGASASVIIALLMLFKVIRHSHVFPDYPPEVILAILERLPVWALSSGLITLGFALILHFVHGITPHNLNNTDDKSQSDSLQSLQYKK